MEFGVILIGLGMLLVGYVFGMAYPIANRDDCRENPPIITDAKSYISKFSLYDGKQFLFSIRGKTNIMALSMTDTQQASGMLAFVDKKGAATDVADGAVTITSSDPSIAAVTYDDPTNTVTVVAGNPGVATLKVAATNKAGATLPFDDIAIEVLSGDAASGTISFGALTEQP